MQQYSLYDGTPPHVRTSDTSKAAARSVASKIGPMHRRILAFIAVFEDPTDDALEEGLGVRHQTISARRRELVLMGKLRDSGRRRKTRSGRSATVWERVV